VVILVICRLKPATVIIAVHSCSADAVNIREKQGSREHPAGGPQSH